MKFRSNNIYIITGILINMSFISNAQLKFDEALLESPSEYGEQIANQLNTIEIHEYEKKNTNCIYLKNGFRSSKFVNEAEWLDISDTVIPVRVDIVYSKYPLRKGVYHEIYPLLFNRLRATFAMDPALNSEDLEWNKVLQTHCENDKQVNTLFHGVVVWYELEKEEPIEESLNLTKVETINVEQERLVSEQMSFEEIEANVTYLLENYHLPDSIKAELANESLDVQIVGLKHYLEESIETAPDIDLSEIDSTTYNIYLDEVEAFIKRFPTSDPVVRKVLDRHPEWNDMLVINDWTGSMYGYGAQVLEWHLLNFEESGIQALTLFNDGDHKSTEDKEIGMTEGIYSEEADNIPQLIDLFNLVMLKGGGGDGPENDIEAILETMDEYPRFSEIVLIADNNACVRDIELADRIGVPVRIILCGYKKRQGVNQHYVYLANTTGGGIYTIDQDIENIQAKLGKNGKVTSLPDIRLKLSGNRCTGGTFGRRSYETYYLKNARYRKRKVRILDASHENLDKIPNWVLRLYALKELNLSHNHLSSLPSSISTLKYLKELDVSYNELEELPAKFEKLKYLVELNLSNNNLSDFPNQLRYMKYLKELDLSHNNLTKIASLRTRDLKKLDLSYNNLTSVKTTLRRHLRLRELDLSNNKLTEFPEALPFAGKLSDVNLSNNQLTRLPDDMSHMKKLITLDLSGNNFSEEEKNRIKSVLIHTKVTF